MCVCVGAIIDWAIKYFVPEIDLSLKYRSTDIAYNSTMNLEDVQWTYNVKLKALLAVL